MHSRWVISAAIAVFAMVWISLSWRSETAPPDDSTGNSRGDAAAPARPAPDPASIPSATHIEPIAPPQTSEAPACATDADFLKYRRDQARQAVPPLYEDLASHAGFSTEEESRVLEVLIEHSAQRDMPLELLCDDAGTARRVRDDLEARQREELERIVGERRMPAFQQYQATLRARLEVAALTDALKVSHLALTEPQRRSLLEVLLRPGVLPAAREPSPGESPSDFRRALEEWTEHNDQRLLAGAREVLDDRQLAQYSKFLAERRETFIHGEFRRAGLEAPPVPSPD